MRQIKVFLLIFLFSFTKLLADDQTKFLEWKKNFRILAIENGISEKTFDLTMNNVKFLPKVIEYDRYQPEFYEDTFTYIKKRASKKKLNNGLKLYKKEKQIIDKVETDFNVEK